MKDCKEDYDKFIDEVFTKELAKASHEISTYIDSRKEKELSPVTMAAVSLVTSSAFKSLKECLEQAPESIAKMENLLTAIIELIDDFSGLYLPMISHGYFLHKLKNNGIK